VLAITVLAMVGFVGLLGQLWYLQTLEGGRLQEMSDKNRIRIRRWRPPHSSTETAALSTTGRPPPSPELEDRDTVLTRVSVLLQIPLAELQEAVAKVPPDSIRPQRVRRGLSLEEVTKLEERRPEPPGIGVEVEPQRVYPTVPAAHLSATSGVSDEQTKEGRYRRAT
jgi:penicillin-binding protein 2